MCLAPIFIARDDCFFNQQFIFESPILRTLKIRFLIKIFITSQYLWLMYVNFQVLYNHRNKALTCIHT